MFAVFTAASGRFATVANLENVGTQSAEVGISAVGMAFVIMTAGIDLSVGGIVFLAGAVMAKVDGSFGPVVVSLVVFTIAGALGLFNGVLIGRLGMVALITTLATQFLFRGVAGSIIEQQMLQLPSTLTTIGTAHPLGVPAPIWLLLGCAIAGHLLLRRTVFGRYVQAVGTNAAAAREVGLPVRTVLVGVYVLSGLFTGLAALVTLGQLGSVEPDTGQGLELIVITATVVGGTSLFGGRGSIPGAVLGAIVLSVISNGLVLVGASPYLFDTIEGVVLVVAVAIDAFQQRFPGQGAAKGPRELVLGGVRIPIGPQNARPDQEASERARRSAEDEAGECFARFADSVQNGPGSEVAGSEAQPLVAETYSDNMKATSAKEDK